MSGLGKQWLWALSWLSAAAACLVLGWRLNLPWLAGLSLSGILAPLTPTSWRREG